MTTPIWLIRASAFLTRHWRVLTGAVVVTVVGLLAHRRGKQKGLIIADNEIKRHNTRFIEMKSREREKTPLPPRADAPSMPSREDLDKLHNEIEKL